MTYSCPLNIFSLGGLQTQTPHPPAPRKIFAIEYFKKQQQTYNSTAQLHATLTHGFIPSI